MIFCTCWESLYFSQLLVCSDKYVLTWSSSVFKLLPVFLNYCCGIAISESMHKMVVCIFFICECCVHTITHCRTLWNKHSHAVQTVVSEMCFILLYFLRFFSLQRPYRGHQLILWYALTNILNVCPPPTHTQCAHTYILVVTGEEEIVGLGGWGVYQSGGRCEADCYKLIPCSRVALLSPFRPEIVIW